jgi:hypothetical protein
MEMNDKGGCNFTTATNTTQLHDNGREGGREMDFAKDLRIGAIGLLMRIIILHTCLLYIPSSLQLFIIPPKYSMHQLNECHFLSQINSSENNYSSLMNDCPHELFMVTFSLLFRNPSLMVIFGSFLQYCVFHLLSQRNRSIGLFYWLNPVSLITPVLSPIPCLHQFLFVMSVRLSLNPTASPLRCLPLFLLTAMDLQYLPIAFSILSLPYHHQRKHFFDRPMITCTSLLLLGLVITGSFYIHSSTLLHPSPMKHFQPGPGITWYLQAQIFPEYASYFTWFLRLQPYITALLLVFRLGEIDPLATVCILSFPSSPLTLSGLPLSLNHHPLLSHG